MHRFIWDLRYVPAPVAAPDYAMATVYGRDVPREPAGPQALPGEYQVRLTVSGQSYTQPFKVTMDPRVQASPQDLEKQFALEMKLSIAMQQSQQAIDEIKKLYASGTHTQSDLKTTEALAQIEPVSDTAASTGRRRPRGPTLSGLNGSLAQLLVTVDSADTAPTSQEVEAADKVLSQVQALLKQWEGLKPK
jgi:hypothetical protein